MNYYTTTNIIISDLNWDWLSPLLDQFKDISFNDSLCSVQQN